MSIKNLNLDPSEQREENDVESTRNDLYLQLFLEMSKVLGDSVFLKGNILLGSLLPGVARATKDLDCSVLNIELYNSHIVLCLHAFAQRVMKPGWDYRVSSITDAHSGGIKIYDSDSKLIYSVDVSVSKTELMGVTFYNIRGRDILGSSIEKILADRCIATLSRQRFRRIKDFYDLYIILRSRLVYRVEDVARIMLVVRTREELVALLDNVPFSEEIMAQIEAAWGKLSLRSFSGEHIRLSKPEMLQVLSTVYQLYDKLKLVVR